MSSDISQQICKRSLISGRVQGVSFRYYTCRKAIALGLTGWVRNLPDGRVEAIIQGDRAVVEAMFRWFWKGSPLSHVEAVETENQQLQQFQAFEIQY
jgi:acylphosphatase